MSDVKSYVAFKREALKAFPLDVKVEVFRSGSHWSVGLRGDYASVWGHYYVGHPQPVKEYCDELYSQWAAEDWNESHCSKPTFYDPLT